MELLELLMKFHRWAATWGGCLDQVRDGGQLMVEVYLAMHPHTAAHLGLPAPPPRTSPAISAGVAAVTAAAATKAGWS